MKRKSIEEVRGEDGASVKDLTDRIEKVLYLEGTPCLVMGFFGSNDKDYKDFIDYLRRRLNIPETCTINVDIEHLGRTNLREYFERNLEFLNGLEGDRILIAANKFERLPHFERDNFREINNSGWHYNQNLFEGIIPSRELALIKKQIIIPTHVGYFLGKEIYEKALTGAYAGSRHRSFMFEVRK